MKFNLVQIALSGYCPNHPRGTMKRPWPCSNRNCRKGQGGGPKILQITAYEDRNYSSHFCGAQCKYTAHHVWNQRPRVVRSCPACNREMAVTAALAEKIDAGRRMPVCEVCAADPKHRTVLSDAAKARHRGGVNAYWRDPNNNHRSKLTAAATKRKAQVKSADRMDRLIAGRMSAHARARAERRARIESALRADPTLSNRALGPLLHTDLGKIAIVRRELEQQGVISPRNGKLQRAQRGKPREGACVYTNDLKAKVRGNAGRRANSGSERSKQTARTRGLVSVGLWCGLRGATVADPVHVTPERVRQMRRELGYAPAAAGRPARAR
jgi:hypothetical protein